MHTTSEKQNSNNCHINEKKMTFKSTSVYKNEYK